MPSGPVLTFNGGSSSWKSALFELPLPGAAADGAAAAHPRSQAALTWQRTNGRARLEAATPDGATIARDVDVERADAVRVLLDAYGELGCDLARTVVAVGHRIVHGGPRFHASVRIDDTVVAQLKELEAFAPSHNPVELAGIAAARAALPNVAQIAAFDTAFHRTLPPVAYAYGGPHEWLSRDIRRYGFHGLSVAYCTERGARLLGRDPKTLRLAVAHLGGGCSVSAVRAGASIDTTMGFTPLDGILMGTRSGAVDPGIAIYLMRRTAAGTTAWAAADDLERTLNNQSGLLGLSGVSSDVRDIVSAQEQGSERAALALDVFAYRLAASIASFLPALGGLDALIFTGGIGEHASAVRARVCARLAACGIVLDAERNENRVTDADIASAASAVRVLVLTAGEEWFIGRDCARVLMGMSAA